MTTPEFRLGVSTVQASAITQVDGDLTRGGLPVPRMTTAQRDAISAPATGLLVFNTTTSVYNVYSGSAWVAIGGSGGAGDVSGPASSTDNAVARFDSTTGTLLQNSGATLDDNAKLSIAELLLTTSTELTIATGAVTITQGFHRIDTEADAASDDLDTINGGTAGALLVIRADNTARTVVVTTAGNILTPDGASFSLDETYKFLLLIYDGTLSKWAVVGGGGGGGGIGGSTGATDNALLRADGTGGSALQSSGATLDDNAKLTIGALLFAATTELTIATGAVTATQGVHTIDTEADAASDDLDTISGGAANQLLIIRADNTARTVVVKHNTGNILCPGAADITLDETYKELWLKYDGVLTKWIVVFFSDTGGGYYQTLKDNGTPLTQRAAINFHAGSNVLLTIADDAGNDETDVTITSNPSASNTLATNLFLWKFHTN